MSTKFQKDPINEIVTSLPADAATGYRVAMKGDSKIYEKQADGTWSADANVDLGSSAILIGKGGDKYNMAVHIKYQEISLIKTPFFPAGNTFGPQNSVIWGDRIVISRPNSGSLGVDMLIIFADGSSIKTDVDTTSDSMAFYVDSNLNLWCYYPQKILKYSYTEPYGPPMTYKYADGTLPIDLDDSYGLFAGNGLDFYFITKKSGSLHLIHFNGYEFEDLATKLKTDMAYSKTDVSNMVLNAIYVSNDGYLFLGINNTDSHEYLVKYDGNTFTAMTIPGAITIGGNVCKMGNLFFAICSDNKTRVINFTTGALIYTLDTPMFTVLSEGTKVVGYSDTKIFEWDNDSMSFIENNMLINDIASAASCEVADLNIVSASISSGFHAYIRGTGTHPIIKGVPKPMWINASV